MKLSILLATLLLSLPAVGGGAKKPKQPPKPKPVETVIVDTPNAQKYGVKFVPVDYYSTVKERELIEIAAAKMDQTIQSQCFKDFIVNRKLIETNGRTPQQVYDHIMGMKEVVPVKFYYRCMSRSLKCPVPTSAVAYRQPPHLTINLNRAKFDKTETPCRWAATLAHEGIGHSVGEYGHDFDWTPTRDFTVPYSLSGGADKNGGTAFSKCCVD